MGMSMYLGQVSQYTITIAPSGALLPPTTADTVRTIMFTAVVPAGQPAIWYGGSGSILQATLYFVPSGKPFPDSSDQGEPTSGGLGSIGNIPGVTTHAPACVFTLFTTIDDYAAIVDLLRNTSPVWFSFIDPKFWSLYCDTQSVHQEQASIPVLTNTAVLSPALLAGLKANGMDLLSK
jgi:hypothetical protein